jgi:tetratricopeptide (TPR) repeat protein
VIRQTAIALAILVLVAGALSMVVARQRRRQAEPMRATLLGEIDAGSCGELRRAEVLARRLVLADARDQGARAALALAGALLAVDCGLPLTKDVVDVASSATDSSGGDDRAQSDAASARALLRVAAGEPAAAIAEAEAVVAHAPGLPQPLYALARARARAGDLVGASRALEAAMVIGPAFVPARLAWAEVRLDLGDPGTAAEALRALPNPDLRARLLLDEVERARGTHAPEASSAALDTACDPPQLTDALEVAACALRDATRARMAGDRARARASAVAAAEAAPTDPRLLSEIAQLLAELGAVDRAATLVARAERLAAPHMPALAWAEFGVGLGRGRTPAQPAPPFPPAPEGPLLEMRAALAAGGVGALAALVARGGAERGRDPDRDALARLAEPATSATPGGGAPSGSGARRDDEPLRAYVDGLRARLAGNLPLAAERFSHALAGHGDACRAAGEYGAILRGLKRKPDARVFAALRTENAGCVNLVR